jgi:Mor family transcriptional regulator
MLQETKLLKDKDIDKDGLLKHLDTAIDDDKWREIFKSSFETCLKEVNEKISEIQKKFEEAPHNIKKEQCNVKFMAIKTCTVLEAFKVNHDESFSLVK